MNKENGPVRPAPTASGRGIRKGNKLRTAFSLCRNGRFDLVAYKIGKTLGFRSTLPYLPSSLMIEPTNACNLRCPLCPTGNGKMNRPKRMMSFAEFKEIIDQVSGHISNITLWNNGEPFLNKELLSMIRYAASAGIYVVTSTNGGFFKSREFCLEVVQSGLQRLIISLDGADQETLSKYRRGANFSEIVNGFGLILEAKKELASRIPTIELQFIRMKHNEHQITDMRQLATQLGVDIYRQKTVCIIEYNDTEFQNIANEFIPNDLSLSRYYSKEDGTYALKGKILNRCSRVYESAVVNSDGTVVPCCYDIYSEYVMGNVFEESLKAIWKNDKYQAFRRQIRKDRKSIPMCNICSEGRAWFRTMGMVQQIRDKRMNY